MASENAREDRPQSVSELVDEYVDTVHGRIDEINYNWVAMMTTIAARHALAMGFDRETIASILIDLGNAIRTQDCAESMGPFDLEMLG